MFNAKKDRQIIELLIEFNLSAISKWIDGKGKVEDIKLEKEYEDEIDKEYNHDVVRRRYYIDILPNGQDRSMYFHREKGIVSGNIGGIDYLENAGDDIKGFLKNTKVQRLSWSIWRQYIRLEVNAKKLIMLVPFAEFVELQSVGELESYSSSQKEQKIKVPISFSEDDQPEEFIEIWRETPGPRTVCYFNGLGRVSASSEHFEVEY